MLIFESLMSRCTDFFQVWLLLLALILILIAKKTKKTKSPRFIKDDTYCLLAGGVILLFVSLASLLPVPFLTGGFKVFPDYVTVFMRPFGFHLIPYSMKNFLFLKLALILIILIWQRDRCRYYCRQYVAAIPTKWPYALPCLLMGVGIYFVIAMWIESQSLIISNKKIAGLLQSIWKLSEGVSPIASYNGRHLLGNVWSPILYPISLIYHVFPHLFGIYMVILAWFCCGLVWLYRTVQSLFKHDLLAAVLVLHVCFNPFVQEAMFNVNPFIFVFPCFMGLFYAYVKRLWLGVYGFMGLSLLCHEYAIIGCVLFGLWLCIATQDKRLGGWLVGGSIVAGYIILNGVMPNLIIGHPISEWALNPGPVVRLEKMILTWLTTPFDLMRHLFSWKQILILLGVCSPYLLVMVWSKRTMMIVFASLLFVWAFPHPDAYYYRYHFALFALPFMYWAIIWGLFIRKKALAQYLYLSEKAVLNIVCIALVIVCVFPTVFHRRYHPNGIEKWSLQLVERLKQEQVLLAKIPTGKRFLASKAYHVYHPNHMDLIDIDSFMTTLVKHPVEYWFSYLSQVDVIVIQKKNQAWEPLLTEVLKKTGWRCLANSSTVGIYEQRLES